MKETYSVKTYGKLRRECFWEDASLPIEEREVKSTLALDLIYEIKEAVIKYLEVINLDKNLDDSETIRKKQKLEKLIILNPSYKIVDRAYKLGMLKEITNYLTVNMLYSDLDVINFLLYIYGILEHKYESLKIKEIFDIVGESFDDEDKKYYLKYKKSNKEKLEKGDELVIFMKDIYDILSSKLNMANVENQYYKNYKRFAYLFSFLSMENFKTLERIVRKTSNMYKYVIYRFPFLEFKYLKKDEVIYEIEKIKYEIETEIENGDNSDINVYSKIYDFLKLKKVFKRIYVVSVATFEETMDKEFNALRSSFKFALPEKYFNILSKVLIKGYLEYKQEVNISKIYVGPSY